ncbi:MAG: hypothetical protein IJ575_05725 [Selenomonadaceae bacterium]|nr:hypothetical protein [Selenomonadaceae bacterium]
MIPVLVGLAAVAGGALIASSSKNEDEQWHVETTTRRIPENQVPDEIKSLLLSDSNRPSNSRFEFHEASKDEIPKFVSRELK